MVRPLRSLAGGALVLAGVCTLVASSGLGLATAEDVVTPMAGNPVPQAQIAIIVDATKSCPALTPARLAGQLMAASRFVTAAATANGGVGLSGMSEAIWKAWKPWPTAVRTDPKAAIPALAHRMCDLVGEVRAAKVPGDLWRLALGAYHSGPDAVHTANGVPAAAAGYVQTVAGYAAWYATQPGLDGKNANGGSGTPAVASIPVPDAYVSLINSAGHRCTGLTPAALAAQLSVDSKFSPTATGANGAAGIAMFPATAWQVYRPTPDASRTDPTLAIPAAAHYMCDLLSQVKNAGLGGDDWQSALAAYHLGLGNLLQAGQVLVGSDAAGYVSAVVAALPGYQNDTRLA